jgi:hypothetical protein
MREKEITLRFAANEMSIPESEIKGLLYNLAKISFDGLVSQTTERQSGAYLRVVK